MTSSPGLREAVTWLYVPADRVDTLLPKALASADGIVVDLEDAVHPSARPGARVLLADTLGETLAGLAEVPVVVRVNEVGTDDFAADVETVGPLLEEGLVQGIRLPKVESAADVAAALAATGRYSSEPHLVPLLESALGVAHAHEIARADGVHALSLGESDLRADLGLPRGVGDEGLLLARLTVVLASRAAGLPSPTASVFPHLRDPEALAASCAEVRAIGFYGRSVIHPEQIPVVRAAFAPSADEVTWARSVAGRAADLDRDGAAAAALSDGSFVDPAIARQAHLVLGRAGALPN